jgi:peptidyl-prolyl cis-trans isomerase SurA
MGEVPEADLAAPIKKALEGLKAGDVSEPVEINGQLHLFQITARTAAGDDPFELAKDEIEAKLRKEKADIRIKEWQKELHDNAHIEIRI